MNAHQVLSLNSRTIAFYDKAKQIVCKKYDISLTSFDIAMFLYNHPTKNTAKEICKIRGIKSGIVSVEVERLVQSGYLVREVDSHDRRIQKLFLLPAIDPIVQEGSRFQQLFYQALIQGLEQEDIETYQRISKTILENINQLEREGISNE